MFQSAFVMTGNIIVLIIENGLEVWDWKWRKEVENYHPGPDKWLWFCELGIRFMDWSRKDLEDNWVKWWELGHWLFGCLVLMREVEAQERFEANRLHNNVWLGEIHKHTINTEPQLCFIYFLK